MKNIFLLTISLFILLTYSCVKDKGNEFKPNLPLPVVKGYATTYNVFTHRDILSITPTVENESQYDFYWTVFSGNFVVGAGIIPRGDTLSRTKNLNYEVLLNPGQYTLVFNVRNKQTSVTQMITSALSVSTLTMGGWYLLKDDGTKTDFDFIYSTGRIDNWMAYFNGKGLNGHAIKSIYTGSFKVGLLSTDLYGAFVVISDQDAGIFRIDNGKMVMGYDNMFFTKPDVKRPQNVLQPQADSFIHLFNDGKVYTLQKGSYFSNPPVSSYKMGSVAAVGGLDMAFDENSKSMIAIDGVNFVTLASNGAALKNMNAEPVWMASYPGARGVALALFRQATGSGLLMKLNITYGPFIGSGTLVTGTNTVPQTHGLMSADVIGGNYDSDYIYYAKGNKIYETDYASLPENLQITLPDGENVTCIQHIKYPQPTGSTSVVTTDYLAIATYNTGNYKVYLHKISSTGTIQALTQPTFTGQGRVSCINYVENGFGNRTY